MPDSLKFGTSGLRGLAADLIGAPAARYTAAFLDLLARDGRLVPGARVFVGQDLRDSSPEIAGGVIGAIAGHGYRPLDCGRLPTPALALAALAQRAPAVMVTGSHIPADRNGLKFYSPSGEIDKADEEAIVGLVETIAAREPVEAMAETSPDALHLYARRYLDLWPADLLAGLRVGVFQHSSVARDLMVTLLTALGADAVPLGRAAGFVAIDTEAVSEADAARCRQWVEAHRLDALVSTDGDADRPLVADETGALVRGDLLGLLTARYLGADAVVTPVTSNSAIESTGYFNRVIRTRVGSPHVIAGMAEAEAAGAGLVVGFEANGGVLVGGEARVDGHTLSALPTRDAMMPMLAVLTLARREGATLGQLVRALPAREARSGRLEHVPPPQSAALIGRLRDSGFAERFFAPSGPVAGLSDIDGLRFTLGGGDVVHYRPSGNAPELRCYIEAGDPARADALLEWGLAAAAGALESFTVSP